MWVKHDPTNLTEPFPRVMRDRFAAYRQVFDRYGQYVYAAVEVPQDSERARTLVAACLDFYAWERGWTPLKRAADESNALKLSLRANLFPKVTAEGLYALLRERRFLVLQGPPGTGKTRLALELLERAFAGRPEGPGDDVIDEDMILLWTDAERCIITGSDLIGRLLRRIARPAPVTTP